MSDTLKKYWLVLLGAILGLSLLMTSHLLGNIMLGIVGIVLLIPTASYLFLFKFKWLYCLMIVTLPLSVHLSNIGLGIGLSLPGEGLLILVFIGVVWRMIFRFHIYKPILYHPISFLILAHLLWMIISSLFSVLPSVSLKFDLIRVLYVIVFYIYGTRLFLEQKGIQKFTFMYLLGLLPIVIYSLIHHSSSGFSVASSNRTCYPFFNDHTIYAACIVMLLPLLFAFLKTEFKNRILKIPSVVLVSIATLILCSGLLFSFSRAGWLSLAIAFILIIPLCFKMKLKWFLSISSILGLSCFILFSLYKPQKTIAQTQNINELISSITDTKKNYSNTERLNRWKSAWDMFKERPVVGFGPGTFMFVYDRYQKDKTAMSVSDASMGGAHSEYLKPLSEQGLLGLLFFVAILLFTFLKGYKLALTLSGHNKTILIACLTGLLTYYVHGAFNFFLDTDKSSILFWGLIGFVVATDLRKIRSDQE